MKKLIRIGIVVLAVVVLSAFGTYLYLFHKPHRNIANEKPAYVLNAEELYTEFSLNEESSYEKYGNQVLQVTGTVVDQTLRGDGGTMVYLESIVGINCYFDSMAVAKSIEQMQEIVVGAKVTVKGQCDGYDMIMGVVITRCVLLDVRSDMALVSVD